MISSHDAGVFEQFEMSQQAQYFEEENDSKERLPGLLQKGKNYAVKDFDLKLPVAKVY